MEDPARHTSLDGELRPDASARSRVRDYTGFDSMPGGAEADPHLPVIGRGLQRQTAAGTGCTEETHRQSHRRPERP